MTGPWPCPTGAADAGSADLHLHSRYSDGTDSPEQIVARAEALGLSALALTDHDTLEGCPAVDAACRRHGIQFIPGVELTADLDGAEVHLLAYGVDPTYGPLVEALRRFQRARRERILEMVERLNRLDVPLTSETVLELADCRSPGRPHVARALVQGGHCQSLDEAFDRFLKRDRPAWVPKWKTDAVEGIALIGAAGGVAAMAHPGLTARDELIPELAAGGMEGLECYHAKHTPALVRRYLQSAGRHSLLVTGGSDCHGSAKGKAVMGTVRLPMEHVHRLLEAIRLRRPATCASADAGSV